MLGKNKIIVTQGIYCIKNKITNKIYIGKSDDIYKRWSQHLKQLRKNKHHNKYELGLQDDWNLYKEEAFEFNIIEKIKRIDDDKLNERKLRDRELYYIYCLKHKDGLYNWQNDTSRLKSKICNLLIENNVRFKVNKKIKIDNNDLDFDIVFTDAKVVVLLKRMCDEDDTQLKMDKELEIKQKYLESKLGSSKVNIIVADVKDIIESLQ